MSQMSDAAKKLNCPQQCDVPGGLTLKEVPPPRHNWSDVLHCPNEGCGKAFLVIERPTE